MASEEIAIKEFNHNVSVVLKVFICLPRILKDKYSL